MGDCEGRPYAEPLMTSVSKYVRGKVNLFICHSSEFDSLEAIVRICETNRYGIELSDFARSDTLEDRELIKRTADKIAGISRRAIHGPYLGIDPVHRNAAVRETSIRCYERVYDLAVHLKAAHVILHPAYNPALYAPDEWIAETSRFWSSFLADKTPDIGFHLENVMDAGPDMLWQLVTQINRPNLDINLDIGHVHVYSKAALGEWISVSGAKIGYTHLHDNHGKVDEHIGLGWGNIPLSGALRELRAHCPDAVWSIEAGGPGTEQSLLWLQQQGFIERTENRAEKGTAAHGFADG